MAHQQQQQQRWAFIADWLDPNTGVLWSYKLFAHVPDRADAPVEVEMFDIKNRRHFLKRVKCEGLHLSQLYVGAMVVVFARQLHLVSYGDEATHRAVEARAERTLALITPYGMPHAGRIINAIYSSGLSIINLRMCHLSPAEATTFCAAGGAAAPPHTAAAALCSGPVVALELMAPSGIRKWLDLLGPADSGVARQQAPGTAGSIRAAFGVDAAHGSANPAAAAAELAFFFRVGSSSGGGAGAGVLGSGAVASSSIGGGSRNGAASCRAPAVPSCCRCRDTTLGVVLPHAVKDGVAGLVLEEVQAAFDVTGLQLFSLDKQAAAEFLEVYKGVVPPGDFSAMVDELTSGPCLAIEVACRDGGPPVEAFRQLVGPRDPELGRVLRPHTLRARFGASRVRNALHCTDLEEDAGLETAYFFSTLQPQPVQHQQQKQQCVKQGQTI